MATDQDIGIDISCGADLDPLCRDVTGAELVAQDLYWRAVTAPGELIEDETYGLGLLDYLGEETTLADLSNSLTIIAAKMQTEFLKDERVFSVLITPSKEKTPQGDDLYRFAVKGFGADGPFAFTLTSDRVTVELLTVAGS